MVNKADRPGVDDTIRDLRQMLELGGDRCVVAADRPLESPVRARVSPPCGKPSKTIAGTSSRRLVCEAVRRARLADEIREAVGYAVRRRMRERLDDKQWNELIDEVWARMLDPWAAARRITALVSG